MCLLAFSFFFRQSFLGDNSLLVLSYSIQCLTSMFTCRFASWSRHVHRNNLIRSLYSSNILEFIIWPLNFFPFFLKHFFRGMLSIFKPRFVFSRELKPRVFFLWIPKMRLQNCVISSLRKCKSCRNALCCVFFPPFCIEGSKKQQY